MQRLTALQPECLLCAFDQAGSAETGTLVARYVARRVPVLMRGESMTRATETPRGWLDAGSSLAGGLSGGIESRG